MTPSSQLILLQKALAEIPRILGHQDLNAISPTYGCFDRVYWGWRQKDIPDASLQYAVYPLALAWSLSNPENRYYQSPLLEESVEAGCCHWVSLLHSDGSCDQSMPFERSVGVTAYALVGVISAYEIMNDIWSEETKQNLLEGIKKSAEYVLAHDEVYGVISNHLALIAFLLFKLFVFLKDNRFKEKAKKIIAIIKKNQSEEGWFLEYQGADPGYQTQCLYYLSEYYFLSNDHDVFCMMERAVKEFSIYFIHPDGSLGGEYGCRKTEIYYPAAFHSLQSIPEANSIARQMLQGISEGKTPVPACLDIPNAIRLATNYFVAAQHDLWPSIVALPCDVSSTMRKYFPQAGLLVLNNKQFYVVVGLGKGGVLKIFDKTNRTILFQDDGWWASQKGNKLFSTNCYQQVPLCCEDGHDKFVSRFYKTLHKEMTLFRFFSLRFVSLIFGFVSVRAHDWFKKRLAKYLILQAQSTSLRLERHVKLTENNVSLTDRVSFSSSIDFDEIGFGGVFSGGHMASAQYSGEKIRRSCLPRSVVDLQQLRNSGVVSRTTTVTLQNTTNEVSYGL